MTHPYVPPQPGGPGAYEQQLAARCRRLEQDRTTLETELGQARQRNAELQQRAEQAEAKLAVVRAIATQAYENGSPWDGEQQLGGEILEVLDGRTPPIEGKAAS